MKESEYFALRACRRTIIDSLDPLNAMDHLYAQNWLTDDQCELIKVEKISSEKSRKLLDILCKLPSEAFLCFLSALDEKQSWLSSMIRTCSEQERNTGGSSLYDLRETLIDGAVPDIPRRFVNRPQPVDSLTAYLRTLSDQFRIQPTLPKGLADLSIGYSSTNLGGYSSELGDNGRPPPTNAWLLIHGPAGCGKTVLCTCTLRQNAALMAECFPGGVVWMHVGPLAPASTSPNLTNDSIQPLSSTMEKGLVALITRLEQRLAHLNRRSTVDLGVMDGTRTSTALFPTTHQTVSRDGSLERLRRILIRRQERTFRHSNEGGSLSTSLLLIVLDDVWDVEVGEALSGMPAAFVVTSRDSSVLERVAGQVEKFYVQEDLSDLQAANLLSTWCGIQPDYFLPCNKPESESAADLRRLIRLCRGSPFAVNLIGNLLATRPHRLRDYLCNPNGSEPEFIDWVALTWRSSYGYDSVCSAINRSLAQLPREMQSFLEQLVIFDSDVALTHKVVAILWDIDFELSEAVLDQFARFSLAYKRWLSSSNCYGFQIPPLQLDMLKASIDPIKQAQYHSKFIANYSLYCSGRWWQLVSSGDHVYFWHHATDHLFKGGQLDRLANLLTDLQFLRGRLAVVGASPVLADFRRYQAVFATLHRIAEWHAYMRFVQTNAYFVIDPISAQPVDRSRSPYRSGSPSGSCWSLDSGEAPLHADSPSLKPPVGRRGITVPASGPKGLDLIQLGLGLPQDSPVFRQSVELLLKQHQAQKSQPDGTLKRQPPQNPISEYYWFWCNSHVAASQLVWAIPTGTQEVTCLAVECTRFSDLRVADSCADQRSTVPSGAAVTSSPDATTIGSSCFRKRYLAATRDGRVLLLDANSGYEVAVQQIYSEEVEVKFLSFVSNNTECLTCGSDGTLVVSTLPAAELLDRVHAQPGLEFDIDEHSNSDAHSPTGSHMGGFDVDDEDEGELTLPSGTSVGRRGSLLICDDQDETEDADDLPEGLRSPVSNWHRRSLATSPIPSAPNLNVPAPIVLADLPRLSELARVDSSGAIPDHRSAEAKGGSTSYVLHSISASPTLDIVVLSGEGQPNLDVHRTDCSKGPEQTESIIPPSANTAAPAPAPFAITLPSVYFLKRDRTRFYLDQSRSLRLPPLSPELISCKAKQNNAIYVRASAVSDDGQFVLVCLSDGFIWLYNLDEVSWVMCASTHLATLWGKQMDDGAATDSCLSQAQFPEQIPAVLKPGTVPSSCLFLPSVDATVSYESGSDQIVHMFAADVGSTIMVWAVPDTLPVNESKLSAPDRIVAQSRPALCLRCPTTCSVLALDACLIADQRVLAAGTTNGRVLFWRIRDGCRLLELSAHASWVTSIRLLPPDVHDEDYGNVSNLPIGLLTASADGVIKRWEVGAACLPSPSTPMPMGPPSFGDAQPQQQHPKKPSQASILSSGSYEHPTAVHGLWTDVFNVWFGPHGSLLVVGRRRHSSDLQFLFRPQQQFSDGTVRRDGAFTFQEVALKPSNSFYWRQPQAETVIPALSSRRSSVDLPQTAQPTSNGYPTIRAPPPPDSIGSTHGKASRRTMPASRHWISTTGLSGTIYGRATAVSFWPCGHWVAVGLSTGLIQIFSLHFDESHLNGIVKRFCLISGSAGSTQLSSADQSNPLPDRVVYLHTWHSGTANSGSLIVLAVFATGTVRFWHIPCVSLDVSSEDSGCVDVHPTESWPPMHDRGSAQQNRASRKISSSELQSKVLCDSTDDPDDKISVTWSTLREIPYCASPSSPPHWLTPNGECSPNASGAGGTKSRTIFVWLTTGFDGMVFGRQLIIPKCTPQAAESDTSGDRVKRASLDRTPWRLNLSAHATGAITDADVDPTGQWLITGSTDQTAKIWCLSSGSLMFATGTHGACVRSVCFRPVLEDPSDPADLEWFIATGDDTGRLNIWRLTSKTFQKARERLQHGSGPLLRSLSPDYPLFSRAAANQSGRPTSSSRNLNRHPSPEFKGFDNTTARVTRAAFFSNAAGFGGAWLRRLVWSSDGRLITGLSDRICVWPFEAPDPPTAPAGTSLGPDRIPIIGKGVGGSGHRLVLRRCRVLRVLSSGISDQVHSSPHILSVGPRRQCVPLPDEPVKFPPILSDLPPTIVTVDVNTGTLYVFDPIGTLFLSRLGD